MAFAIVGETVFAGKEIGQLNSHREAVREAQEAVKRAERIAETQRLPPTAVARLAAEELKRVLPRALLAFGAIVTVKAKVREGSVIELIEPLYRGIIERIMKDPGFVHKIPYRQWDELIAASYDKAGFDEVILTPRSGDLGRDVIAIKKGFGSVRFVDQVKAYSPDHLVEAKEVRELLGVLSLDQNATKAILTTTSYFAPGVLEGIEFRQFIPYRLELVDRDRLLERLEVTLR